MDKAKGQTPPILVLHKAMTLLKCFTAAEPEHTIASLMDKLDMPKSSIHRLLITLQQGGLVTCDSAGVYRLGIVVLELASALLHNLDYRQIARPILQDLADSTGESIYLSTLNSADIVYLDEIQANRYVTMSTRLGSSAPAYCSAMGKVLLAELSKQQFDSVFSGRKLIARTEKTVVDYEELWQQLRTIAVQGYAFDNEEFERGICCLAAPIRNFDGTAIAAFSISAPSVRLNTGNYLEILPCVLSASVNISIELGYKRNE